MKFKNILLGLVIAILLLPGINNFLQLFGLSTFEPLKGVYPKTEKPVINAYDLRSSIFQKKFYTYVEENIGGRPFLIRLNNQIAFTLFDQSSNNIVIGKQNFLYDIGYIKSFLGDDFMGEQHWDEELDKLLYIQDNLEKKGIIFFIVIAPGKGSFYPEYFPDRFHNQKVKLTNYQYLSHGFTRKNLHFLDFNKYFHILKDTARYPLYPIGGIHWSAYGEALVIDSVKSYLEKVCGKKMISLSFPNIIISDTLRPPDKDIEESLNLFFNTGHYKMPYPEYSFIESPEDFKPRVITIADSYYSNLYDLGITRKLYQSDLFLFYFTITPEGREVKNMNVLEEMNKSDVVMILATEANLFRLGFGFIEEAYESLRQEENNIYQRLANNAE